MKKILLIGIVLALLVLPLFASAATYYVATNGNDNNDGKSLSLPFRTIQRARDAIRASGTNGNTVNIRGGVYRQTSTLTFGNQDSGAANNENVYQAYQGENVRIVGGIKLNSGDFSLVTSSSSVYSRLDTAARGRVMQLDLSRYTTNYGNHIKRTTSSSVAYKTPLELFFNQEPMQLARWPNFVENNDIPVPPPTLQVTGTGLSKPEIIGYYDYQGEYRNEPYYKLRNKEWYIWIQTNKQYYLSNSLGSGTSDSNYYWRASKSNDAPAIYNPAGLASGNPLVDSNIPGFETIVGTSDLRHVTYQSTRPERWDNAEEIWMHGFFASVNDENHIKVSNINTATKVITLADAPKAGIINPGGRFYIYNLLEEIDIPGEWYLNRDTDILYFWPPNDNINGEMYVSIPDVLVDFDNAEYITFKGITFELARLRVVYIEAGKNVQFENCIIRNSGGDGVRIINGLNHGVDSSQIYNTGGAGIYFKGSNRNELTPTNNFVHNTHIHHFGRWGWNRPGVWLMDKSVGVKVTHNLIHDSPSAAITIQIGNDHVIEYNEIHDVRQFHNDGGAIYEWHRDWGSRGTKINYNYIHHIDSPWPQISVHCIYLDDATSGHEVIGNICYEIEGFGIQINGGRDNIMKNNIFVKCRYGLLGTSRTFRSFNCDSSIPTFSGDPYDGSWNLMQKMNQEGINFKVAPWSTKYPALAAMPSACSILDDRSLGWTYPEDNVFSNNIGWQSKYGWMSDRNYEYLGGTGTFNKYAAIAPNVEDANPLFVDTSDPYNMDLNLRSGSPAYTLPDWVNIPFDEIGLIGDSPPPQCSGTCKSSSCSYYDNCVSGSGTCSSGYCCSGDCTNPIPPSNEPIAEYNFDQSYGTTVTDSSGNSNHCDVYGATWTNGILGNALLFDGTNDYLDCGNSNTLNLPTNNEITLSAWVNLNTFPTINGNWYILGKGYDGTKEAYFLRIRDASGTRTLEAGSYETGVGNQRAIWNIAGWNPNSWHHVVGLYDGSYWRIYFDGNQKTAVATQGPESNTRNVFMGAFDYYLGTDRFFNGIIDEVKIYNRALTSTEIQSLYQEGESSNPADINQDNNVDFDDLILVAVDFGKTIGYNSRADTNTDGEVDIFDVVFVASRI